MNKDQIEQVLSQYYVIMPPEHVIVLDRQTVALSGQELVVFRGLQPRWRTDVVILTPEGNEETLLHECFHAQFSSNEFLTDIAGKILARKLKKRRFTGSVLHRVRNVKYDTCAGCELCNGLEKMRIKMPLGATPSHYIRRS